MARFNDSFWSIFLSIWSLLFSVLLALIKFMFGLHKTTSIKIMTCEEFEAVDNVGPLYDIIG